jgi:putative salt-induced outer membrane protein YdiY
MMAATRRRIPKTTAALAVFIVGAAGPLSAQTPAGPAIFAPPPTEDATPPSSPWPLPGTRLSVPEATALTPAPEEELPANDSMWYQPSYWFGPTPWDSGIELGLNGSTGTNESLSIRTGGYVKHESKSSKFDFSIYHNRTTTSGLTTQNNATLDLRNDWSLDDSSRWTLFAKANLFYDQFQTFDLQTNANSGIGYQLLKLHELSLTGRVGSGASREFGGPNDDWVPEALFGVDYEQKFADTHKIFYKFEYFPEIEEFGQYRMVTDAGWEISLAKPSNVSLKLSATDRYDSTPNGADPHLVNYSVLLLLKL